MFTGKMTTESTPERVYAMYSIVKDQKSIRQQDLKRLIEPEKLFIKTSYFNQTLTCAKELGLVKVNDDKIELTKAEQTISSMADFRIYVIEKMNDLSSSTFYRVTNALVNLDEDAYKAKLSDVETIQKINGVISGNVDNKEMNAWRLWIPFMQMGYIHNNIFIPNAYGFIKTLLPVLSLEKGKEYPFEEFMRAFNQHGGAILTENYRERNLNIAMSHGLRMLDENREIDLLEDNDRIVSYTLYPMALQKKKNITGFVYKGVNS